MYNGELLEKLKEEFGEENTILFCKMESRKNDLLYASVEMKHYPEAYEYDFERDWWRENGKQLEFKRVNNLNPNK